MTSDASAEALKGWWRSALLAALAIVVDLAALRLISAPPFAVYQHYSRPPELSTLSLLLLAVQGAVCVPLAWTSVRRGWHALSLGWVRGLLVAGAVVFSAAVPTQSIGFFATEVVFSLVVATLAAANLIAIGAALPDGGVARLARALESRISLPGSPARVRPWDGGIVPVLALFAFAGAALIASLVFERMPHIDDSISYLFQAKVLSTGRLALVAPPDSAAFHVDEVLIDGSRWFGYGFPGWPALLGVGVRAGAAWLVNPVLASVTVPLAHRLVRATHDRGAANAVALLLALSPWLLFMSGEMMGHPLSLALSLAALLAAVQATNKRGSEQIRWAIAIGASLGALFLTRPMDAMLVGAVAAAWLLGASGSRLPAKAMAACVATGAATASLVFAYNAALTGRWRYAPQMMWTDRRWGAGVDRLGFGSGIGIPAWRNIDPLPGHGLPDVVLNLNKNLFMANLDLFGWAMGSLAFVWLALVLVRWRRADVLYGLLAAAFVVGYSAYWFSGGPDLGPRYWYPAIVAFIVLTVRGAQSFADRLAPAARGGPLGTRLGVVLAVASLTALVAFVPWRATTKHHRYRGVGGDVRELAERHGFGRALVFVRSPDREHYQSAFNLNPPALAGPLPIYAADAGVDSRRAVVQRFSDRPVYVIAPTGSAGALAVIAGPLPAGSVPP